MTIIRFECPNCNEPHQAPQEDVDTDEDGDFICEDCADPDFPVERTIHLHDEYADSSVVGELYSDRDVLPPRVGYEVDLDVRYYADGSFDIIGVNGKEVVESDE